MTLFKKLTFSSILLVSFAIAISTILATTRQAKVLSDELSSKGQLMARQIGLSTSEAFRSLNWLAVERAIQNVASAEEVIYCKVVMPDGTVYLADDKEHYGKHVEPDILETGASLIDDYVDPRTGKRGKLFIETVEIGQESWWVLLAVSSDSVNEATRFVLLNNLLVAIAIMIPTIIGSLVLSKGISEPIVELASAAQAFAAGRLDHPIDTKATGEVGVLAESFNAMAEQLRDLIGSLEQRVAERTMELTRRAKQLQAVAEVSRAAGSVLDIDELLNTAVKRTREQFDLYYVGIFLVDAAREYAWLRAGTGDAGREMLARQHKLAIGETSMIGWCVQHAQPRIALDVGEDAVHFDNPVLPDTRSEMALPLSARGEVIGAMTVQSTESAAFSDEDILVLQTMADQVANAITNAQLYEEARARVEEISRLQRQYSREAWTEVIEQRPKVTYQYTQSGVELVSERALPGEEQALKQNRLVVVRGPMDADKVQMTVVKPIALRGQVIGTLGVQARNVDRQLGADDTEELTAVLEAVGEQMALALENARLFEEAQRRAARERLSSEVTARMRETLDVDAVLQAAVREIGEALRLHDVTIQLEMEADQTD